jgi:hypothetical protein
MDPMKLLVKAFPIILTLVLVIGYCLKPLVGPHMCYPFALIVIMMIVSCLPPDDPEEET